MVKGVRGDIDKIINHSDLPSIISTTLLMFNGNIIFKSFFESINIKFGNDVKKEILNNMKTALTYYHL